MLRICYAYCTAYGTQMVHICLTYVIHICYAHGTHISCIWYAYGTAFGMSQTWHKVLPHFRDLEIIINRHGCGVHILCTSRVVSFYTYAGPNFFRTISVHTFTHHCIFAHIFAHTFCTYICTYILHIYIFVPHAFVHLLCKPCKCILG